jgi:hypothetical protein
MPPNPDDAGNPPVPASVAAPPTTPPAQTDGAAAPTPTPGTETSSSSPSQSPAASETTPVSTDPSSSTTSAEPKPDTPPTLLAGADAAKRDGAKPEEGKPEGAKAEESPAPDAKVEAKPPEGEAKTGEPDPEKKEGTAPEPPPPRTYEPFKAPEGVTFDEKQIKQLTDIVGVHQLPQEAAQQLIDLYVSETNRFREEVARHQVEVWNRTKEQWINDVKSDPELGGNRMETVLGNAKHFIENLAGTKEQFNQLMTALDMTGMGNHPALIRLFANAYERYREPSPVPANPGPPLTKQGRDWYSKVDGSSAA